MTDYEKYIALLNAFEIPYAEEITDGHPKSTLVYITEDFNFIDLRGKREIHNSPNNLQVREEQCINNTKVSSYLGFYCYFSFEKETGKFEQVGIFE